MLSNRSEKASFFFNFDNVTVSEDLYENTCTGISDVAKKNLPRKDYNIRCQPKQNRL